MSRTDKDAPYRVKVQRAKKDGKKVYARHYHSIFGREVFKTQRVRDDEGNIVYTRVEEVVWIMDPNWQVNDHVLWEGRYACTHEVIQVKKVRYYAEYERVLIGYYANECTLTPGGYRRRDPVGRNEGGLVYATCQYYTKEKTRWNRPRKDEKKSYHSSQRNIKRQAIRSAVSYYNSQEISDLGDDDYYDYKIEGRTRRHFGWWD